MNRTALQRIKKASETGATSLDLRGLKLTALPAEIEKLTNLTLLDLSDNGLTTLPAEIERLTNLTLLDLSNNGLTALPAKIEKLTNLTELYLSNNGLTALPAEIEKLTNLTELYLGNNGLTALPAEIEKLTNLTLLGLSNNGLTALPAEIGKLTNLTQLDLSNNGLTALPAEIEKLTNLTLLDLSNNGPTALPAEIKKLTNLTELYLSNNGLTALPAEIEKLANLTLLYLSNNGLTALPVEIEKLTNLTQLDLSNNGLTALPAEIEKLTTLTQLDLQNNQLETLPPTLWKLPKLKHLSLDGNPLVSPPLEIVAQGDEAVNAYFEESGPTRALAEVKLVLVGHGAAGKTSLVKKLQNEEYNPQEEQTHGIHIREYEITTQVGGVRGRIWDFGGQEIMHATHRFFLSRRSLFVVVLDGRHDENPEYWLSHASTYSSDAPVLVVLNKTDQNPCYELDFVTLGEKYPQIKGFTYTSCKTGAGIDDLKLAIAVQVAQMPMIQTQWPEHWIKVKESLERSEQPYLSRSDFSELCERAGVRHDKQQAYLVTFLNDLGIAIHFEELHLDDTHVLNPAWATNGVYRILNHPELAHAKGLVATDRETLTRLLERPVHPDQEAGSCKHFEYPREKHGFIIELMQQFQLCFEVANGKVLLPALLPKSQPSFDFDYEQATKFRCSYGDFLPPTVMPNFMVKQHQDLVADLRWRSGMVIEGKASGARAVVRADGHRKQLLIWILGVNRRDYLATLRETLAQIHEGFPTLPVRQEIGCPCESCRLQKEPYFFDYEKVLGHFLNDHTNLPCNKTMVWIPIRLILDGISQGQTGILEEIRDDLKEVKHKQDFDGNAWDKFKERVSLKLGFGPLKVDVFKVLGDIIGRRK